MTWLQLAAVVALLWLTVAHIALIVIVLGRARQIKDYLQNFPTHAGTVVTALVLIFYTGVVIIGRLALGKPWLEGYGDWLIFLGTLAGITGLTLGFKRFSSAEYQAAKAAPAAPLVNSLQTNVFSDPSAGGALPQDQKDGNAL